MNSQRRSVRVLPFAAIIHLLVTAGVSGESAPRLSSVEPTRALYSAGAQVTISGTGLMSQVAAVELVDKAGSIVAAGVSRINGSTIRAAFSPVAPSRVGRKDLVVRFANGKSAMLPNAFLLVYDQDPVVFVHGCPLPLRLGGSGTNYQTSKYWYRLYSLLHRDGDGYPAPEWRAENAFISNYETPHPATKAASNNYLNVFVLSEDSRNPVHDEKNTDPDRAGHCGSAVKMAAQLGVFVDSILAATGAEKVDIVANSAGVLGARLYLARGGWAKTREFVALAGINHGTEVAIVPAVDASVTGFWTSPNYDGAREAFPAYACQGEAPNDVQSDVNGCARVPRLGGTPEIPDDYRSRSDRGEGVSYLSIYNIFLDELVQPTTSACLNQKFVSDCSDLEINVPVQAAFPVEEVAPEPYEPHHAIRFDPEVLALTVCHLQSRSPYHPTPATACLDERNAAMTR